MLYYRLLLIPIFFLASIYTDAQQITTNGVPGQLDIREISKTTLRITLKPVSYTGDISSAPFFSKNYTEKEPVLSIREINKKLEKQVGELHLTITAGPLKINVTNNNNEAVQEITFQENGIVSFKMGDQPILGLGEGGPKPKKDLDWRLQKVQFDRRYALDSMQPRWQSDMYGTRNPVPLLAGTEGWALFVAAPWVYVDLRDKQHGRFIPWKPQKNADTPQTKENQGLSLGKGLPPIDKIVPGFFDLFVFDSHKPSNFMKDYSVITGPSAMPPKWALGYMQSHRTLEDEDHMIGIVDTFRKKEIPLDAVIYLGTGFCPRGWNKPQPSFQFNPEVFHRDPEKFMEDMHERNVKVILHMVPWDRDKLPTLHGNIPANSDELIDSSHIFNYWQQHLDLVKAGVDGFWPDEGDWFNLFERIERHQMYYQGSIYTTPNERPWSLQRNGYPGIAQWGGWVWSGDTQSSWKTLKAQIAVGINYSLSIGPFWGSDTGGFYSNKETTGELYARWFQFSSFCGSFRSHGRTWHTRLPWGWGLDSLGPIEDRQPPLKSELNNSSIEPIVKKYDELRYRLLPYNYTLAWEARNTGMPLMRAMWLEYPKDENVRDLGTQFMWGNDILIAPIFEKGATNRKLYLPKGNWYDWWNSKKETGGKYIVRDVNLETMPVYVREGAIIPLDPVRQYVAQEVENPTTIKIFTGKDGEYTLYEDDGISLGYLDGKAEYTNFIWDDNSRQLEIDSENHKEMNFHPDLNRVFKIELLPSGEIKTIHYFGKKMQISF